MFALAASNMILRGDGKANLHQASCFDDAVIKAIKKLRPNVGVLNPPYAQSKSDAELHEFCFVKQMLECLRGWFCWRMYSSNVLRDSAECSARRTSKGSHS